MLVRVILFGCFKNKIVSRTIATPLFDSLEVTKLK